MKAESKVTPGSPPSPPEGNRARLLSMPTKHKFLLLHENKEEASGHRTVDRLQHCADWLRAQARSCSPVRWKVADLPRAGKLRVVKAAARQTSLH